MPVIGVCTTMLPVVAILAITALFKALMLPAYAVRDLRQGRYGRGVVLMLVVCAATWAIWPTPQAGEPGGPGVAAGTVAG